MCAKDRLFMIININQYRNIKTHICCYGELNMLKLVASRIVGEINSKFGIKCSSFYATYAAYMMSRVK